MSYEMLEMEIIRDIDKSVRLKDFDPVFALLGIVTMVGELANHEIVGDLKEIKKSVGDVVCALIVYCASHDISLTKCLAKEDLE